MKQRMYYRLLLGILCLGILLLPQASSTVWGSNETVISRSLWILTNSYDGMTRSFQVPDDPYIRPQINVSYDVGCSKTGFFKIKNQSTGQYIPLSSSSSGSDILYQGSFTGTKGVTYVIETYGGSGTVSGTVSYSYIYNYIIQEKVLHDYNSSYTMFFPVSSPSSVTSIDSIQPRPYPVRIYYQASTSATISEGLVFYVQINSPNVTLKLLNADGSTYANYPIITAPDQSVSSHIDIPAGKVLKVDMNAGRQCKYVLGFIANTEGYNTWCKIRTMYDDLPPTTPGMTVAGTGTSQTVAINGKTHTSSNNPVLTFPAADNGPVLDGFQYLSGLENYLVDRNGNTSYQTQSTLSLEEGEYTVKVRARDRENNSSPFCAPVTLVVDRSINPVTLPANPVTATRQADGKWSIQLRWNPLTDLSGITSYETAISTRTEAPAEGEIIRGIPPGQTQYVFTDQEDISTSTNYYLYVRGVDGVHNQGTWTRSNGFTLSLPAPSLAPNPITTTIGGVLSNGVELTVSDMQNTGITYIIEREGNPVIVPIQCSYQMMVANHFTYTDTDQLHKHGQYRYSIRIRNNIGIESGKTITGWITIPNLPAEFAISGPEDGLISNARTHAFDIHPKQDAEGDALRFRVIYRQGTTEYGMDTPFQTEPYSVTFPGDGVREWWLQVQEYTEDQVITTIHTQANSRRLTIDTAAPAGSFVVKSASGDPTLDTAEHPTSTREVSLGELQFNDQSGLNPTGVKGIYFWNGSDSQSLPDRTSHTVMASNLPGGLTTEILNDLAKGTHLLFIDFGDSYPIQSNLPDIPWQLPDTPAGTTAIRAINMAVTDRANNHSTIATRTVKLDRNPPGTPGAFHHSFAPGQLIFSWQCDNSGQDVAGFVGQYTLPTGAMVDFNIDSDANGSGSLPVSISSLQANQPITITVSSMDKAENASLTTSSYIAYTPALLGTLTFAGTSFDQTTGRHQLRWNLQAEAGTADGRFLEYGQIFGGGFTVAGRIYSDENGVVLHDRLADGNNLQPHTTYNYRQVAINRSGDRVEGTVFAQEVSNLNPTVSVALAPVLYARSQVEFQYEPALDYDGDTPNLVHRIFLAEGENPAESAFLPVNGTTVTGLVHGRTYTWFVEARDPYNGFSRSERVRFVVDGVSPVVSLSEVRRPYTNQTSVTVNATDALSGIAQVNFKKLALGDGMVLETGDLTLTNGNGTIPLTEGEYHLRLMVRDRAGNLTESQLNNLYVDHTPPILSGLQLVLPGTGGRYLAGTTFVTARWHATDSFTGVKEIRYWLTPDQKPPLDVDTAIPLSYNLEDYTYTLNLPAASGREYHVGFQLTDRAGNQTVIQYRGPVLFDLTPPVVSLALANLREYGGGFYLQDLVNSQVNLDCSDPETNLKEIKLAIRNAAGELVSAWGTWALVKETDITEGEKYRVIVRATNEAGLETEVLSEEFLYDESPPEIADLTGPTGVLCSGEQAVFTVSALDLHSTITGYRLALYNEGPDPTMLTTLVPGNRDGWIENKTGNATVEFRMELPVAANGRYYPVVEVTDAAGWVATRTGSLFSINNDEEKILVGDQGPYTMLTDKLTGWWRLSGTRSVTGYRYRIVDTSSVIVTDWQTTTETMVTVEGLSLEKGRGYRFEVQGDYGAGLYSVSGFSPGIVCDPTGPELTILTAPQFTTSSNLWIQWNGNDPDSGICRVEAALGSDYYATDVTGGWVTVAENTGRITYGLDGKPLQLQSGVRYYLTLRLTNGSGMVTEQTTPGIVMDDSPPPQPVVMDQGAFINTNPYQSLEANWVWAPVDPESGNV